MCPIPTSRSVKKDSEHNSRVKRSASILKDCNVYRSYIQDDSSDLFSEKLQIDSQNQIMEHPLFGIEAVVQSHATSKEEYHNKISRGIQSVFPENDPSLASAETKKKIAKFAS